MQHWYEAAKIETEVIKKAEKIAESLLMITNLELIISFWSEDYQDIRHRIY